MCPHWLTLLWLAPEIGRVVAMLSRGSGTGDTFFPALGMETGTELECHDSRRLDNGP
jgi:hypothetical protein